MTAGQLKEAVLGGGFDERLAALYGEERVAAQRERYAGLCDVFTETYGEVDGAEFYSVPGRSEISGNHTDHNHGRVLCASIDLDIIAVAAPADDGFIRIESVGFAPDSVEISKPESYRNGEQHSAQLVAGTADGLRRRGYRIGALKAVTTSNVLKGSGLSSSAAFEDMCVNLQNYMYNGGAVGYIEMGQISQYAENEFFGKPCGLMDQIACAAGGFVAIDFADPADPKVERLTLDLAARGYTLCIVDTGGNHADLTEDYASIPREMRSVAGALGCSVLRETDRESVIGNIVRLRASCGDRAVLRALHFFDENDRVEKQADALRRGDLDSFFDGVRASGASSAQFLQNTYTVKNVAEQGISLGLALATRFLAERGGVCRVHGGGFAGTVQAYVRSDDVADFRALMESVFGAGSVHLLRIRGEGAVKL